MGSLTEPVLPPAASPAWLEWGVASQALRGHPRCGDLGMVHFAGETALVAAIDGLGHGDEAADAAEVAAATLEDSAGQPLEAVFRYCHEALKATRGAVLTAALIDRAHASMKWFGVGNVEAVLVRARGHTGQRTESVLLLGGLLGMQLPGIRVASLSLRPGDTLIMATDGIQPNFSRELARNERPQQIAQRLLHRYAKGTDDALVLVVRFLGP